jgi:hypothetical protein
MITQKEFDKMKEKPLLEVKRRIRKILSGKVTKQEIVIDGCIYNNFHAIQGSINVEGKYILTF